MAISIVLLLEVLNFCWMIRAEFDESILLHWSIVSWKFHVSFDSFVKLCAFDLKRCDNLQFYWSLYWFCRHSSIPQMHQVVNHLQASHQSHQRSFYSTFCMILFDVLAWAFCNYILHHCRVFDQKKWSCDDLLVLFFNFDHCFLYLIIHSLSFDPQQLLSNYDQDFDVF